MRRWRAPAERRGRSFSLRAALDPQGHHEMDGGRLAVRAPGRLEAPLGERADERLADGRRVGALEELGLDDPALGIDEAVRDENAAGPPERVPGRQVERRLDPRPRRNAVETDGV